VGNLADAFRKIDGVAYYGLDVDAKAIAMAQRRFRGRPNFDFFCGSPAQLTHTFDLVYFAGVLHHLPDDEALSLLQSAVGVLKPHSRVVLIEPHPAAPGDAPLVRWYANSLEQGHNLRSVDTLQALVAAVPSFCIQSTQVAPVGATPFSWPLCAHFIVMEIVFRCDE
jgi:SAM-dependent methyltransferase